MKKDVLYLSPGMFDKGGISRYCRYQVQALRDLLGPDSITALSLLPPDDQGFEVPFRVDFASFGPTRRGKSLYVAAAALAAVAERPSIVWCAHLHIAPVAVGLARLLGARSVLNVYGAEVWTDVTKVRAAAVRRVDQLISDCHSTLDDVIRSGLHRREGTRVHWDCVDLTRFTPGSTDVLGRYGVPPADGRLTVLTLARMAPTEEHKGIDRLITVFSRLPHEAPVRLVIAGGGGGRPQLEALARELKVDDRVHFTGFVSESDLPDVYRSCDVFSLVTDKGPGRGEGIPLTPLEAAACGRPILVGNQDGSREAAEDGRSGYVLDPFDLEAIADRILRLARDPELRARMGSEALARIRKEHGYEIFRDRLRDLLDALGRLPPTRS
jgi:phosphatidylinositol alpha-1,6-mannosyltransferase